MESIEKLMLDKITVVLKRFSVNEIRQLNKILIINLDWNDIARMVTKNRLRMNVGNVVGIINEHLNGSDRELIKNTYYRVLLADAVCHHRSQWRTVSVDKIKRRLLDKAIIKNRIRSMMGKMQTNGIIYVMKYDDMFMVSIDIVGSETDEETVVKLSTPHLFAIASGNGSQVFYKSRRIVNFLMNIVVRSVGANKFQPYPLTGKNVRSMIHFLEDKDENETNAQMLAVKRSGKDRTRTDIQQLYFNKRQKLDRFTVHVESVHDYSNKINKLKVELIASSITNGIRDMILAAVLTPPYPDWVIKLPFLGTNNITLSESKT